ncbi:MAG: 5-(carboxyamino)imidazole ribonucleotide mutase [Caldisericia bacterium]|jgi:5-(carboxyamino)imidazole ribonucleotide mutase|nr:5-(carboxyamino)imidazole ribonucleotide mutase [Caldisericia bacterium]
MVDNAKANPIVSVVMGSDSDLSVMQEAIQMLSYFDIPYEIDIVSAHRTPDKLFQFAKNADKRGIRVIIAGAGGAAHLPGMIAAISALPVIGVPIRSSNSIDGWDSILSILQMPNGVPVATVALNAAKNAGILATQIIAVSDINLLNKVKEYKENLRDEVLIKGSSLSNDQNKHNS